jgi:ATP-dependent protease ClpP protease subunit
MATVKEFELIKERMIQHYQQYTGLNKRQIEKYLLPQSDVWLSAEEAVKYGLADKIYDLKKIKFGTIK